MIQYEDLPGSVVAPGLAPSFTEPRWLVDEPVAVVTCLSCGAGLMLFEREGGVDVLDLHRLWHARICPDLVPAPPVPSSPPVRFGTLWSCSARCWHDGGPHDEHCRPVT